MPAAVAALRTRGGKARKKREALKRKRAELLKQQERAIDLWFVKFDINHDQGLQKSELFELLKLFQPDADPPDELMLSYLMSVSAKIDGEVCTVKRSSLQKVMMVYRDYAANKDRIDPIFEKFDRDQSGFLERSELLRLLKTFHAEDPESYPEPEEYDSEFILTLIITENDKAHSPEGSIAKDEVLPAIATWKAFSDAIMQKKQQSKTCAVM